MMQVGGAYGFLPLDLVQILYNPKQYKKDQLNRDMQLIKTGYTEAI